MALKHSLEGQIEVLRVNLGQRAERIKARNLEEGRLRTADGRLREEKGRLMDRKKEIQQQKHKYDRMKQAIDSKQIQYDNLQSQSTSSEEEEARIKQEIRACTVKKAKFALSLAKMQEKLVQIFYGRTLAALRSIKLAADLNAKENELADLNEEREELQADLVKINNHLAVLKTVARELLEAWNKAKGDNKIDEEQAAPIVNQEKYKGMTLDELQELAEEKKTRADLIMSVDPAQIARFEADKKAIITKQADAERGERKATEIAGKIERVKNKWQPQLEELVAKISVSFSKAFDGIGCAGEVKLSPDPDDYDKWGIEIFVKFRDNEKLHALDGQRQSGGSLSNVPFRVVDEINQGMDPRNERMVHREMVRAACKAGTSQYFLITPKLLADLEYHERMKVLNVFNGPFNMPAIDFRGYLNRKRQVANTA
ncbi:Structural maintenance of chromosomes protein 5 [Borealophlyctis nickersoniae]|nr:Structural maintenance of chromosomes protein 5 [Borealophlyctis nickersoniae]